MRRLTKMFVKSANAVDTSATPATMRTIPHAIIHAGWCENV